MDTDPNLIDGSKQGLLLLVRDEFSSVPTGATINHVENNAFAYEDKVTFNLLIELVSTVNTTNTRGSGSFPFTANGTGVHNFRNEL